MTSEQIKSFARSIGVDLIGIAPAEIDEVGRDRLSGFIQQGRHGNMTYLEDYKKRVTPQVLLPGAKSVIVIGINYYYEQAPLPRGHGRIARYAYGRDYHKVLKGLLKKLEAFIQHARSEAECGYQQKSLRQQTGPERSGGKKRSSPIRCKICVDSAPILEKSYAEKAGLGFIGKNTTLITPEFGSFVLLGELLTTLELDYDQPKTGTPRYGGAGTCGTCTRCLDACPTQAIISAGQLDARRCISYLTIENRGEIPTEFHKSMGKMIFGCDICQEVCPYNKVNVKPVQLEAFKEVKIAGSSLPLDQILTLKTDAQFLNRFAGSPLMRAKRAGLQRNAKIAQRNATIALKNQSLSS